MPLANPIRLDRLQQGLFLALSDALAPATVGWVYGQAAFETVGPELVSLQMANGPSYWTQKHKRGRVILPFDSLTLNVAGSTPDVRDIVRVNGIDHAVDVVAQTPEQIRDELVSLLNANPDNDPWSAAAGGSPSELVLTPTSFGSVFSVELVGELAEVSQVASGEAALLTEGTRVYTITVQTFSKQREPRNGAWSLMARVESVFETEEYVEQLESFGVALWDKGIAADISAIAGANWESRVTVDLQVAMRSAQVRPVDQIEQVKTTFTARGDDGNIIAIRNLSIASP